MKWLSHSPRTVFPKLGYLKIPRFQLSEFANSMDHLVLMPIAYYSKGDKLPDVLIFLSQTRNTSYMSNNFTFI